MSSEPRTYTMNGRPGCVETLQADFGLVCVWDRDESDAIVAVRWAVTCETHMTVEEYDTLQSAMHMASYTKWWCPDCRDWSDRITRADQDEAERLMAKQREESA